MGALFGQIAASSLAGGGGLAGEKQEELKCYLRVALVGVGVARSGGAMGAGGPAVN